MAISKPNDICIVAGEASGDVQGAKLVAALQKKISANFWGVAGPALRSVGVEAFLRVEDLAVMGFWEVAKSYLEISQSYKKLLSEIRIRKPKALIVIDYPAFNLKLIQDAYALGVTVVYHIPPKAWAHGERRVEILKTNTHLVTSILPFEENFFRKRDLKTVFVGNPLKDAVDEFKATEKILKDPSATHIGLFPGSRISEIDRHVELLVEVFVTLCSQLPHQKLVAEVAVANTLDYDNFVNRFRRATRANVTVNFERQSISHSLARCDYAWVCSGTAALETALFGVPNCVFYRTSAVTYFIGKMIVELPFVSLTNLCAGREVVPEFLQEKATVENLVAHAKTILQDDTKRSAMTSHLLELGALFPTGAADRAADAIVHILKDYDLDPAKKFHRHALRDHLQAQGGERG